MKKYLWIFILLFLSSICYAETVILKSGKVIEGKITEDTEEFIKIEIPNGESLYFYKNTIEAVKSDNEESPLETTPQVTLKTGVIDCLDKGYMLFIPARISSASPAPVLICLPGIKPGQIGVPAKQDIYMWTYAAEKNGFIVINLEMDYNLFRSPSDIQNLYYRIKEIVNSLSGSYPIDTQKLYIAGTSGGGAMSIALALMFPNKFVAVGVVGGARFMFWAKDYLRNAKGNSFYMVHGQRDKAIPIGEFYSTKKQLVKNGAIIEFHVFPEGEHILTTGAYKEVVDWLAKIK